jgi:hypothetical protein
MRPTTEPSLQSWSVYLKTQKNVELPKRLGLVGELRQSYTSTVGHLRLDFRWLDAKGLAFLPNGPKVVASPGAKRVIIKDGFPAIVCTGVVIKLGTVGIDSLVDTLCGSSQ